jgi:hypothetical protein
VSLDHLPKVHRAIVGSSVVVGRVNKVLALVRSDREVLEVNPAILRLSQSTARRPAVLGRELTSLSSDAGRSGQHGDAGREELHIE